VLAADCIALGLEDLHDSVLQQGEPRRLTQLVSLKVKEPGLDASIIDLATGMISKTGLSLNRLRSALRKHQSQSDQMTCNRRAGCSDVKLTEPEHRRQSLNNASERPPKIDSLPREILQAEVIVHRDLDILLGAEIALCRLDRRVAEQELDLFEIPAALPAQLGAGTAEVVSPEVFDPDLLR
jgi:hypothetical protein